jgi:hypothetical protein
MYDNELSGVIFKQEDKKHDKAPDYWGKVQVDGNEYKIAGWIKEGKKGKFISIKLTPAEEQYQPKTEQSTGDDVPF